MLLERILDHGGLAVVQDSVSQSLPGRNQSQWLNPNACLCSVTELSRVMRMPPRSRVFFGWDR
jgi:hypothetical protein